MRIAILMTNTDESGFADRHPKDGQKFTDLLALTRPDWTYDVYPVKDGVFPQSLAAFDGAVITGSPASARSGAGWIARLEALVRDIVAAGKPLFGACLGHQVIAQALGGDVGDNPGGWEMGAVRTRLADGTEVAAYASHKEQVLAAPDGAEVIARTPGCDIAGFAIGGHVMTTQYHPEMTPEFFAALLEEVSGEIGPDVTSRARASLGDRPDMAEWSARITGFLEAGKV